MEQEYDVIVVGAGFAGITASRELSQAGHSVLVLEARDRIGGRTWTKQDPELGGTFEFGGQFVHWTQPFLWREIRRHGLRIQEGIAPKRSYWLSGEQVKSAWGDESKALLTTVMEAVTADSRAVFPNPYQVDPSLAKDADNETLADRLNRLDLTQEQRELVSATEMEPDRQAITQVLRRTALCFWDWTTLGTAGQWFRLETGMSSLINAIADEGSAEIKLSTPVAEINDTGDVVRVTTRNGDQFLARSVLVAVPINTMSDIKFTAGLPPAVEHLIHEGTVRSGFKVWVRVRGEIEPFAAYTPQSANNVMHAARVDARRDGDTFIVGFGRGTAPTDLNIQRIQQELQQFVPEIEVLAVAFQDWAGDEFSKSAWIIPRTGQLTEAIPALQQPHGRIRFAGGDIADGYQGWVEGAIDSATLAAQAISRSL